MKCTGCTSVILMSRTDRRKRKKKLHKRRRPWWRKLTWTDYLIYMPFALFLFLGSFGYYAIDLYLHPCLWNGVVFVAVTAFLAYVFWPRKKSR